MYDVHERHDEFGGVHNFGFGGGRACGLATQFTSKVLKFDDDGIFGGRTMNDTAVKYGTILRETSIFLHGEKNVLNHAESGHCFLCFGVENGRYTFDVGGVVIVMMLLILFRRVMESLGYV